MEPTVGPPSALSILGATIASNLIQRPTCQ
jgi:hypothetical protein